MKILIPTTQAIIVYEGQENHLFTAYAKRPFPTVSNGDVIFIDKKTAGWLINTRKLPFREISPDDLSSLVTPSEEKREGVISGIMSKAMSLLFTTNTVDAELLNRFIDTPNDLNIDELKRLCKLRDLSGYSSMPKQELIDLLTIDLNTPLDPLDEEKQ